ncbi:helix-turn-helix domain-containing protein [Solihabitans fulvus]|uniref:Helix-turn-helix domain-containing protein n=1 Tax=Solihabitans fulvus TaxID=1892852 RepID=A0A5B2XL82_9PSEU|nr:helix-turn-helix transcriptional regulator [Solihabitans fulvus]KAA2264076.1 helix-turn-helix domain-containing protein [Solihabitans fulvus]
MGEARQTVERRQLGLMLQKLRIRTDKSQQEAGAVIGRTAARISQVETAKGALRTEDLSALLDFYEATDEERATIAALGIEARRRQPRRIYSDQLPDAFRRLGDLQADASSIGYYEFGRIPGPLQSPYYVRALIGIGSGVWWDPSTDEAETRIALRLDQQRRVLDARTPKQLSFVFTEDALRHVVGDRATMRGQVLHLVRVIDQRPELTVRILPADTRDNPALGGGIVVLDFVGAPRICFTSAVYGPYTYYDQEEDTVPLTQAFQRVRELALNPADSRALLTSYLEK